MIRLNRIVVHKRPATSVLPQVREGKDLVCDFKLTDLRGTGMAQVFAAFRTGPTATR